MMRTMTTSGEPDTDHLECTCPVPDPDPVGECRGCRRLVAATGTGPLPVWIFDRATRPEVVA